jgi:hypothetical protein
MISDVCEQIVPWLVDSQLRCDSKSTRLVTKTGDRSSPRIHLDEL